jgi:hypothetical protein
MLTRLISVPAAPCPTGANQVRQQLNTQEQFWRGNAESTAIRMRTNDRDDVMLFGLIVAGKR